MHDFKIYFSFLIRINIYTFIFTLDHVARNGGKHHTGSQGEASLSFHIELRTDRELANFTHFCQSSTRYRKLLTQGKLLNL